MRLYLSSFLLGNRSHELVALTRTRNAVVVANGLDNVDPEVRVRCAKGQAAELRNLGFQAKELDLREYFDTPESLPARLNGIGLIWATGGNAFLLRRAMRQSELDRYIVDRRDDDAVVYGGYSAGACVAGPTLRGIDLVDTSAPSAAGYADGTIWEGLALVPYSIAPHYRSEHPESSLVEAMVQYFIDNKMPFVALRDGEVIISVAC